MQLHSVVHNWVLTLPFWAMLCVWLTGNLLLALIPVALAHWLRRGVDRDMSTRKRPRLWLWGTVAMLWLLFFPNTAYLLTEWRHYLAVVITNASFRPVIAGYAYPAETTSKLVFLTAFFGAYTLSGMAALVMAMRPIDQILSTYAPRKRSWAVPSIFLLCSVGVYLGLVDRLNSWDMLNSHTLTSIVSAPLRIVSSPWLATLIVSFAAFLWLFYLVASRSIGVDPRNATCN